MKLAVDIETRAGHIACVGIAWNERDALCIPLMCVERPAGYWSEQEEAQIAFALYQILTHPNCEVIGQNFSYDAQYFWRHLHFLPRLKRDTMLTQHTLFANLIRMLRGYYCHGPKSTPIRGRLSTLHHWPGTNQMRPSESPRYNRSHLSPSGWLVNRTGQHSHGYKPHSGSYQMRHEFRFSR